MKIRKLKLGDKLSSKEKEHLKLKRVDRGLGLGRFKLAGKMMEKIRWRKNAQKANSKDKSEEINKNEQSTREDSQQENGEQQYEEEDGDDNKDQEEDHETSSSNLYDGLTNVLYPAISPLSTGYMTTNFNMMDLYPSAVLPVVSSASDRRDLRKKYEAERAKKIKKLEHVNEHIKEDQIKTTDEHEKSSESNNSEEVDNDETNDQDENSKLSSNDEPEISESRSTETSTKSINHPTETTTVASSSLFSKNILQPIFTPDERQLTHQLTPSLYSLIALTTNPQQQRLSMPSSNQQQNPTATLPIFTPAKSNLENSAALLLPLIARQSHKQQQLIRAQRQELLAQEAKEKELTKKLQQANEERNGPNEKDHDYFRGSYKVNEENDEENEKREKDHDYFRGEHKVKNYMDDEPKYFDKVKERGNSKPLYSDSAADYLDNNLKSSTDNAYYGSKYNYNKASINRLRRRKSDENQDQNRDSKSLIKGSKQDRQFSRRPKAGGNDEFDFSEFDEDLKSTKVNKLRRAKQARGTFAKRMFTEKEPDLEESKLVVAYNNDPNNLTNNADDKAPTMNETKLSRNASLIVYGY